MKPLGYKNDNSNNNNYNYNNKANNTNSNVTNIRRETFWLKGKREYKKFGEYNFKKSTFWKTTLGGILATLLVTAPVILLMVALYKAFYYKLFFRIFMYLIAWGLVLFCNGLSNYFTVQMSKTYVTDDEKLQNMDAFAIMFYNCFNIGFMIITLLIVIFVMMVTL